MRSSRSCIYGDVSDADMEKGQMRCDCNVSVRPEGQTEFGTKIEIKNMNSISGVRRALAYEIERQTARTRGGPQAAAGDASLGRRRAARLFSCARRKRRAIIVIFPIPTCCRCTRRISSTKPRRMMPELPGAKRKRYIAEYALTAYDASVLADDLSLGAYFEEAAKAGPPPAPR